MAPQTPAATAAILNRITAGVADRIAKADAESRESQAAFVAGKFEEYFQRKAEACRKRLADEYDEIVGPAPDGGDS